MKMKFRGVIVNRPEPRKTIRIAIIMGGGKACLAELLASLGDIVVYIDNPVEVENLKKQIRDNRILFVPTGGGQTLHEQLVQAGESLEDAPLNISFHGGSGAMPKASLLTMRDFLQSSEYQQLVWDIQYRVRKEAKGEVAELYVHPYGSFVGGKCAGGLTEFLEPFSKDMLRVARSIVVVGDFMGALAFNGVSAVAPENAAGVLPRFATFFTKSNPDEPGIVKLATFHEAPLTDSDEELRHRLITIEAQAIASQYFREYMLLIESNLCALGRNAATPFKGNLLRRRTEYLCIYDDELLVSNTASMAALKIEELQTQLAETVVLIDRLEWDSERAASQADDCPLDRVLDQAPSLDEESLVTALLSTPQADKQHVGVRLVDGTLVDPTVLAHEARTEVHTVEQVVSSYSKLLAAFHCLEAQYNALSDELAEHDAMIDAQATKVKELHRKMLNPGFFGSWSSGASVLIKFPNAASELRELALNRKLINEQLTAVLTQLGACEMSLNYIRDKISAIARTLKKHTGSAKAESRSHLVLTDGDTLIKNLWPIAEVSRVQQLNILRSCVGALNLGGLAAMLGSKSLDYEDLAKAIIFNQPEVCAPSLGGIPDTANLSTTYMLPQMSARDEAAMAEAIRRIAGNAEVGFCDVLSAGVACLRIRLAQCNAADELFRGYLGKELPRAYSGPHSKMVAIGGSDDLTFLRIRLGE